jgi:hypothetical protein
MSEKIRDQLKLYSEVYVLNPPKNSDRCVLYGDCIVYFSFVIFAA